MARGRPFAKGASGNPAGRPKGAGDLSELRAALLAAAPSILLKLVQQARAGDPVSAKLVLERCIPVSKPSDAPIAIDLGAGSLAEQGRAVLTAVTLGQITSGSADELMRALGALGKIVETEELAGRIAALEAQAKKLEAAA